MHYLSLYHAQSFTECLVWSQIVATNAAMLINKEVLAFLESIASKNWLKYTKHVLVIT
jgi:hypothetical protein